jgi:hypothetical protein
MDFRRSGQLDERRRRVLMDEIAAPSESDGADAALAAASGAKGPVRAYSSAVLSERQLKVTDLLPIRPLSVVILILLGLTGLAAIEAIHIHAVTLPLTDGGAHLAALDVRQRGSLAAWYSSALLATAAAIALVIFGVRSHRVDDYRGRYRIWLWAAAALLWLSLDAATGVHEALGLAVSLLAGKQLLTATLAAGCTVTWFVLYGLIFGTLWIRLAIEVWSSLLSFAALSLAAVMYLFGGLLRLEVLSAGSPLVAPVVGSTVMLLAHLSLVTAVFLYGRHVYLDARGRLKVHIDPDKKKPRPKSRATLKVVKGDAPAENSVESQKPAARAAPAKPTDGFRFGAAPSSTNAAARPGATISKASLNTASADEDEDDEDDGSFGQNLSKSERRRLKKLARQQQRRAA